MFSSNSRPKGWTWREIKGTVSSPLSGLLKYIPPRKVSWLFAEMFGDSSYLLLQLFSIL